MTTYILLLTQVDPSSPTILQPRVSSFLKSQHSQPVSLLSEWLSIVKGPLMELFSRGRWRLVSGQEVSCRVHEIPKINRDSSRWTITKFAYLADMNVQLIKLKNSVARSIIRGALLRFDPNFWQKIFQKLSEHILGIKWLLNFQIRVFAAWAQVASPFKHHLWLNEICLRRIFWAYAAAKYFQKKHVYFELVSFSKSRHRNCFVLIFLKPATLIRLFTSTQSPFLFLTWHKFLLSLALSHSYA